MSSNSEAMDSEGDTLRQRSVTGSQKDSQAQTDSAPDNDHQKEKKAFGRTPDGVGEYTQPLVRVRKAERV